MISVSSSIPRFRYCVFPRFAIILAGAKFHELGLSGRLRMNPSIFRRCVLVLLFLGIAIMPIGPCMVVSNEGFGDPPRAIEISDRWKRLTYVLLPIGAAIAIGSGIVLVILDRKPKG